jgi:hypothetical protein
MHRTLLLAVLAALLIASTAHAYVFINEIDYDQPGGTDTEEFIELAGTAGTNVSGWMLELVNGNDNTVYNPINLPNFTFQNDTGNGWGFLVLGRPTVANNDYDLGVDGSVQNGAPDGARLINNLATVVHYVGYEGSMPGSTDDVPTAFLDDNVTPNSSIYKTGTGELINHFTWAYGTATPGAANVGQTFTPEPSGLALLAVAVLITKRNRR